MSKPFDPTLPSSPDSNVIHAEEWYCSACNQSYPSGTKVCPNDGARLIKLAAERDQLIGRVLDERYEIRAPLGKGGMGTVYRGWQLSVDREVAIKVIHPKLSNDRGAVKRFLREARLASRLSQPNIVNVYDFGQFDGVLYLVMELLRGQTLASQLGRGRRINAKRTVTIAQQLCDALEAAHAQGIVHRDLKPSNIVILDDPPGRDLLKVLDFGLAKSLVQDSGSVVTNTDALLGTPLYMAPEQIEGKESDQRADLYALGCILYEMLTGKPPFVDAAVSTVLARHIAEPHAELPAYVPSKLRALVDAMLAKDPVKRIQSAGEVRRVLDDIRESTTTPLPSDSLVPSDTIPDVDVPEAFAVTHAMTPTPVGMYVTNQPASVTEPIAVKPRRYGLYVLALFVLGSAGAFVLLKDRFGATRQAAQPTRDAASEQVQVAPIDAGVATSETRPDAAVVQVAPAIDAGVATDTASKSTTKKTTKKTTRTNPTSGGAVTPAAKPDAGVPAGDPDINWAPPPKQGS